MLTAEIKASRGQAAALADSIRVQDTANVGVAWMTRHPGGPVLVAAEQDQGWTAEARARDHFPSQQILEIGKMSKYIQTLHV